MIEIRAAHCQVANGIKILTNTKVCLICTSYVCYLVLLPLPQVRNGRARGVHPSPRARPGLRFEGPDGRRRRSAAELVLGHPFVQKGRRVCKRSPDIIATNIGGCGTCFSQGKLWVHPRVSNSVDDSMRFTGNTDTDVVIGGRGTCDAPPVFLFCGYGSSSSIRFTNTINIHIIGNPGDVLRVFSDYHRPSRFQRTISTAQCLLVCLVSTLECY